MKPQALTLGVLLLAGLPAIAPGHEGHHPPAKPASVEKIAKLQIPDTPLRDQEGRPVHFYSDLVQGKVVAVNFVFTSCTTVCLPMGAGFGKLRAMLGDRAGKEVHLISVSVDPATDTPAKLKAWSQKFGAGRGWTLVTGDRNEVTRLLKSLGAYAPNPEAHSPLVLLGNDARGEWTRANGLSTPAQLAALLDGLARREQGGKR